MTKTATTSRYDTASVSVINYSDLVFVSNFDIRIWSLFSTLKKPKINTKILITHQADQPVKIIR